MSSNSLTIIGTTNKIRAVGTHVDQYGLAIGGDIPCRTTTTPYNPTTAESITGGASVGTSIAPFSAIHLTADSKIWQGDVEFSGGAGGGGGGLESLALANSLDKQGASYPLPNNKHLRNAFTDDTEMLLYLRKSYSTADTTAFVADHGLASELETLNDFQTIGDFTTGTSAPTLSVNTTDYLENTQSIKFTATALNGSADMYESVTLSLTDRNFRVSCYPDELTNVTSVYIVLYTSSGNQRKFDFAVANLTVDTWNHLTCDLNLDDGATSGGVTVTDTGTFERLTITRIYYGITTNSAQTVVPSFDLSRAISDKPLLIPDYGLSSVIQDSTNQDTLTITDEDDTDYTTKGTFTIAATLGNNYTNISSVSYASSSTGDVSNNKMQFKATASGQNAQTCKQHEILATPTTMAAATLESFLRFYDDSFEVDSFPTTGTINLKEISAAATEKGRFLDDSWFYVFKKLQGGRVNQTMSGSYTVNFMRLQLSANAGDSGDLITLAHDGDNSFGSDTTGYYVVPESAYLEYSAGAKTASTFTRAIPAEFLLDNGINVIKYSDYPYLFSNWKLNEDSGNAVDSLGEQTLTQIGVVPTSTDGVFGKARGPFGASNYFSQTAGSNYESSQFFIMGIIDTSVTGATQHIFGKTNGANNGYVLAVDTANSLNISYYGVVNDLVPSSTNVCDGEKHLVCFASLATSGTANSRLYIDGVLDASANGASFSTAGPLNVSPLTVGAKISGTEPFQGLLEGWVYANVVPSSQGEMDALVAAVWNNGDILEWGAVGGSFIAKYEITELTNVNKLETITTLKRDDTSNQDPVLYETGSLIY
ncbi:MAG: LamG domain-containing protein [bacterium]|nr:LamG domain-containing protein [bacterium]